MDYLEFIARVTSHIPDKGQVVVRYYNLYANAQLTMRPWTGSSTAAGAPGFTRGSTSAAKARPLTISS